MQKYYRKVLIWNTPGSHKYKPFFVQTKMVARWTFSSNFKEKTKATVPSRYSIDTVGPGWARLMGKFLGCPKN